MTGLIAIDALLTALKPMMISNVNDEEEDDDDGPHLRGAVHEYKIE